MVKTPISHQWQVLDGWRALAAISVFLYHLEEIVFKHPLNFFGLPTHFLWQNGIGVDIFFVLSGLLLWGAAHRSFGQAQGEVALARSTLQKFWHRRWLRLAPLYYFSFVLLLLLLTPIYLTFPLGWVNILLHLLFLHSLWFDSHGAVNGVYWTLSLEAMFYALVPFFYWARRQPWRVWVFPMLLLATWGYRAGVFTWYFPTTSNYFYKFIVAEQFFGKLDLFVMGMWLSEVLLTKPKNLEWWRQKALVILGVGLAGTIVQLAWTTQTNFLMYDHAWGTIWWHSLFGGGVTLMVAGSLLHSKNAVSQVLSHRLFWWLSQLSYGIYIWHLVIMKGLVAVVTDPYLATILAVGLTLIISSATYYLVELRFWKRKSSS